MIFSQQSSNSSVGKLKEFLVLLFPILLMAFSSCLFLLIEKVLLARLSIREMEAAVSVAYICQIFQITCTALAMMAQVSVAAFTGANDSKAIGPTVWQFIWFSFFSIFITLPVGILYGNYFLSDTGVQEIAKPYFYTSLATNFLYPLGVTLSCFYLGRGKTRFILLVTVGSQVLKIALAFPLILGWENWLNPLGLIGGAISTLVAQGSFCLILFLSFVRANNRAIYASGAWQFKPKLFYQSIKPGLLRAANRILNVTCWASVAQLMASKGGDYLAVLSIGGALSLFLPFLGDAICQTQTIIVSQILGAGRFHLLRGVFFLGFFSAIFVTLITSVPLVFFPQYTFSYLFSSLSLDPLLVQRTLLGVWVSFAFYTSGYVGISYILAFKDMWFSLLMGGVNWINGYLLIYIAIEFMQIGPEQFWLVHSIMHGSTMILYFFRVRYLSSEAFLTRKRLAAETRV